MDRDFILRELQRTFCTTEEPLMEKLIPTQFPKDSSYRVIQKVDKHLVSPSSWAQRLHTEGQMHRWNTQCTCERWQQTAAGLPTMSLWTVVFSWTSLSGWRRLMLRVLTEVFQCNRVLLGDSHWASLSWIPSEERSVSYDPSLPPSGAWARKRKGFRTSRLTMQNRKKEKKITRYEHMSFINKTKT